jgi:hypothetical protein
MCHSNVANKPQHAMKATRWKDTCSAVHTDSTCTFLAVLSVGGWLVTLCRFIIQESASLLMNGYVQVELWDLAGSNCNLVPVKT